MPKRDPMLSMSARERTQYKVKKQQEEQRKKREQAAKQESARRQYTTEGAFTPKTKVDGSSTAAAKTTNQTSRAFAKETGALAAKKPEAKPAANSAAKPKPKPTSTRQNVAPTSSVKPKPKPERKNVTRKDIVKMYGNVPEVKAGGKRPEPKREQFKSAAAYQKAWREWNRSRGR